jgi:hypothetical protein
MGFLDTTQDQSSMPRALRILHVRDAMMRGFESKERLRDPQVEYYL